jgi:hypothetical protein
VPIQDGFESADVALINGSLRQHHAVNAADFITRGDEQALHKVQIEPFLGGELEEAERLLRRSLH